MLNLVLQFFAESGKPQFMQKIKYVCFRHPGSPLAEEAGFQNTMPPRTFDFGSRALTHDQCPGTRDFDALGRSAVY